MLLAWWYEHQWYIVYWSKLGSEMKKGCSMEH